MHGAIVDFFGAGILREESGSDVVGLAGVGEGEKRARAGDHAVALILGVGGVADFFGESVIGVLESAHHGGVNADVEDFEAVGIAGGVEETVDGFGVGALRFGEADDGAVGFGDDRWRVGGIVEEFGSFSGELGVKFFGEGFAGVSGGCIGAPLGAFFERFGTEAFEKLRIDGADLGDHFADDGARFVGGVAGGAHAPEAMEDDAGDGVNHRCESGDGEYIAGDFDGAFFGGALDFLEALGMRHGAYVPDVAEDGAGVVDEEKREFTVGLPGAGDGLFVDGAVSVVEEERRRRDVGLRAIEADVTLALLLGIIEGVSVEERPDELAADIFEAELEMRVLVDGVMAAVEGGGADVEALLVGDFFGRDEARGVTGAGGGDGGIVGMREGVAESDAGWGGFDEFAWTAGFEHAGLCGHVGGSFYTEVES